MIEEQIEEILYSDSGVPEIWAGSEESIPKDKRIEKLKALLTKSNEEAVRGFVAGFINKKDKYLREELGFTDRDVQMLPSEFEYIVELEEFLEIYLTQQSLDRGENGSK